MVCMVYMLYPLTISINFDILCIEFIFHVKLNINGGIESWLRYFKVSFYLLKYKRKGSRNNISTNRFINLAFKYCITILYPFIMKGTLFSEFF